MAQAQDQGQCGHEGCSYKLKGRVLVPQLGSYGFGDGDPHIGTECLPCRQSQTLYYKDSFQTIRLVSGYLVNSLAGDILLA